MVFKRAKRSSLITTLAVVVALVATACGSSTKVPVAKAPLKHAPYLAWSPCCSWGTTWSYNMFNAYGLTPIDGLVYLPLAAQNPPSLTSFTPQLADSWSVTGRTLTVHLRSGVKWQNGSPVTSKDVYDTIMLYGTDGGAGRGNWQSISAPNSRTIVLTAFKNTNMSLAEGALFTTYIYPSEIYGRFVSSSLLANENAYYSEADTHPAAAAKMPQFKALGTVFNKLAAMKVPRLVGDGAFMLKGINTQAMSLVKWPGFYDAKNIHVPGIKYYDNENNEIYPQLYSGTADFSNVYMPPNILTKWNSTPDSHTARLPAFVFLFLLNDSHYPLTITKVRQALAYIIPRNKAIYFTYGKSR